VVDRHQDHRDAAGYVDRVDTAGGWHFRAVL
jgi:hypothetical protein